MYIYSRAAVTTNYRHGLLGMHFRLLSSCYPISPLFHLVKHMASKSAFRGMGLFLSLSLFPSVIYGHGMQLIPPFQMGKETNTVHVGHCTQTWLNTTQWLIQILFFLSVKWQRLLKGSICQVSMRQQKRQSKWFLQSLSSKVGPPKPIGGCAFRWQWTWYMPMLCFVF